MTCQRDRKTVRLADGEMVCTWCPRWRLECEARAVLAMPTKTARQLYLRGGVDDSGRKMKGVLGFRGEEATVALERLTLRVWRINKGSA